MNARSTNVLALAAVAALSACGVRGSLYTSAIKPLPLVATSAAMVQVVPQTRRAVIVAPGEGPPAAAYLSANPRLAARVPGAELVTIFAGTPKAPKLDLLDVSTREVQTLDVPGFFDTIVFSDDGRFGLLAYVATAGTGQLTARNLNEVALLAVQSRTLVRLQLDTESLAPRGVLYGPAEPNRQLVAVLLERGVAIFDALHPDVAPRRISIRPQGSTSESSVQQAVFSADAHWLYLRASGLDDVIAVELGPEIGQPVAASINFVSGGRGLSAIERAPSGFPDSVLAVYSTSAEAWLLDARGIQDNMKSLQLPAAMDNLKLLDGTRVLLWDQGGKSVAAWDVADGRSGTVTLDATFAPPIVLPDMGRALFAHSSVGGSGPALSTLVVTDETNRLRLRVQGIQLAKPLAGAVVDGATQRLFFSVAGSSSLVTMDLRTLQLVEVALDSAVQQLWYLPQGDWLVADHVGYGLGDVTVVPAGTSDRAGALRYTDFALTGDLDRPGDVP